MLPATQNGVSVIIDNIYNLLGFITAKWGRATDATKIPKKYNDNPK